ncbi:MAG: Asp-tRNA(Asn)/Glu-tRNA(Gln) amidotransferase subunit GatC [Planctomycetota bacterium]
MPIDPAEIRRIVALARLEAGEEEVDALARDLQRIVDYIDRLQEVEVRQDDEALPYFDADVHREDRTAPCLDREEALWNAPEADGEFFVVPRILARDEE